MVYRPPRADDSTQRKPDIRLAKRMNLGNPGEFTILELARKVIAMTGSSSKIEFKPLPADDPTQRKPDIGLAKRILDWTPRVVLDDGLTQAIAYFRDSNGGAKS